MRDVSQRVWIAGLVVVVVVVVAASMLVLRPSDEDQIRERVQTYYDALADSDYPVACDQLATAARQIIASGASSCVQGLRETVEAAERDDLDNLHGVAVERVRVDGVRAFATVNGGHTLELLDERDWRILDPGR